MRVAELTPGLERLLDSRPVGVVATERPGGRPSQSVVYYAREGETLLISSVEGRRKVEDVERSGWASLSVMGEARPFPPPPSQAAPRSCAAGSARRPPR